MINSEHERGLWVTIVDGLYKGNHGWLVHGAALWDHATVFIPIDKKGWTVVLLYEWLIPCCNTPGAKVYQRNMT